jgi:hypothetical protein
MEAVVSVSLPPAFLQRVVRVLIGVEASGLAIEEVPGRLPSTRSRSRCRQMFIPRPLDHDIDGHLLRQPTGEPVRSIR